MVAKKMLQHYIYKKQIKEINRLDSHNTSSANNLRCIRYVMEASV